ncbi:MAG: hypothetical protein ABFQ53_03390, partial [Patescibacteria group bacterium]
HRQPFHQRGHRKQIHTRQGGWHICLKAGENAGHQLHHQQVVRFLSPKKVLQAETSYSVKIESHWNKSNLGVGALVQAENGNYLQAVFSQLSPENQK